MKMASWLSLFSLLISSVAAAQPAAPTQADQQKYIAMAESLIRSKLKDPESARFSWPNGFVQGTYKSEIIGSPFTRFEQKYAGWITCGTVNAKNGYGGYGGAVDVIVVGEGYGINAVDMDDPGDRFQYVAEACRHLGF